jgi:DNA topoisomerase-2
MASDSEVDVYMVESDFDEDDMSDSNHVENAKPAKKIGGKAKAPVLGESSSSVNVPPAASKGKNKTVEEIYQKKTQLEHILLRPDTYSKFLPSI